MGKKSIMKIYLFSSISFGILMGVIFPLYSIIFVNFKSDLSMIIFSIGCIIAGILVGVFSYIIGKLTVVKTFNRITNTLATMANEKRFNLEIDVESNDSIGTTCKLFNEFSHNMEFLLNGVKDAVEFSNNFSNTLYNDVSAIKLETKANNTKIEELQNNITELNLFIEKLYTLTSDIHSFIENISENEKNRTKPSPKSILFLNECILICKTS